MPFQCQGIRLLAANRREQPFQMLASCYITVQILECSPGCLLEASYSRLGTDTLAATFKSAGDRRGGSAGCTFRSGQGYRGRGGGGEETAPGQNSCRHSSGRGGLIRTFSGNRSGFQTESDHKYVACTHEMRLDVLKETRCITR